MNAGSHNPIGLASDAARAQYETAERLEQDYDFREAYRAFLNAFERFRDSGQSEDSFLSLVRAGLCLERFQNWRALSALWEMAGNRLGDEAYPDCTFPIPKDPGQSGMFHIISWANWTDPEAGYYTDNVAAKRKHQQYWAYLWAGESLEAERHYRGAAKNFRKAAFAAASCEFGDRTTPEQKGHWTIERLNRKRGLRFKFAAECFFKAIKNHIAAHGVLQAPYTPKDALWYGPEPKCIGSSQAAYSDLQRMHACWSAFRAVRQEINDSTQVRLAREEELRQLQEIQHLLTAAGSEQQAREVFWQRRWTEIRLTNWPRKAMSAIRYMLLDAPNAVRLSVNALLMLALTFGLMPKLYESRGLLSKLSTGEAVGFYDAILHSCAATVAASVPEIVPVYPWGQVLSVGQSFLFYFFLIYIVYVFTKKPEE